MGRRIAVVVGVLSLVFGTSTAFGQAGPPAGSGGGHHGGPHAGGAGGPGGGGSGGKHGGKKGKHRKRPNAEAVLKHLDVNQDGMIDASEAAQSLLQGHDIMQADADGDGFVTRDELKQHLLEKRVEKGFAHLDTNGDGSLDASEIANAKHAQGLSSADTDGDGLVSFAEFQVAAQAKAQAHQATKQAFQNADTDGDKKLSEAEWNAAGGQAPFADVDADADGAVTPKEIGEYAHQNGASPL